MASKAIIEKIQGLLSLAQGNSNLNESAAAFAVAQQLLLKHNLTVAQIEATTGIKEADEKIVDSTTPLYVGQRVVLWKSNLADQLARLNSCKMYIHNEWMKVANKIFKQIDYRVVGRPSDVEVVTYFFNTIVAQIERFSAQAIKAGVGRGKTFTNNFKHGASEVVIARLKEMNQAVRSDFSKQHGSAALVLVDQKAEAVQKWVDTNLELEDSTSNYRTADDPDGYLAGRAAGKKVALNKGLDTSDEEDPKLLD